MEKSQTDLLQQFQEEIAALRQRIEALESQITALQAGGFEADDEAVDFTDIELGVEVPEAPVEEPVAAPEPVVEPEPVAEPEPEAAVIPVPDRESEEMANPVGHDEVFAPEPEPSPVAEPEPVAPAPKAQGTEDETARLPWRTDKPGISVKNIRSGISLLDRALFIGTLFKEDFALYDQTIADLNAMSTLDEAVDYVREHFPAWNLKSDVVYHFMMSVRKKLG